LIFSDESTITSDGKDWRDERALFGALSDGRNLLVIYRMTLDQHYEKNLTEEEFNKIFKKHLDYGLDKMNNDLQKASIVSGEHILYLMEIVKNGLNLINTDISFSNNLEIKDFPAYGDKVTISIGKDENNEAVKFNINDLTEFDSCNMAIAGMVGSGKTELVKDILFQISKQSGNKLKFIFFDYKGEGNAERLESFFKGTGSKMVDLRKEAFDLNPLSFISLTEERTQTFNIKSFVDFVCTIATNLGSRQKHILQTVISDCFQQQANLSSVLPNNYNSKNNNAHPTLNDVFEVLKLYYEENELQPDSLYTIISDLATSIFKLDSSSTQKKIYEESLYINLPLELSDTLRQLCVFLTLKYLLAEFSSTNDTEPDENRIKPLRYIIVIDEAHVYLKNKNASKALEEILRVLRSKGIVTIMLSQGVEDYKTKNFDFSSQIKIPICLNINNKDYNLIQSFVGTPRSKQKLQDVINSLESEKAVINIKEPQLITINQFWKTISGK
jgi:DNA sulfur modification protein DndE